MPLFIPNHVSGPYYYLPSGWDTAWQNAKANAGSQRTYVTGIGDSIMNGAWATDIMIDSWWANLRTSLLTNNTLGGDHYGLMYSAAGVAVGGGPGTATPPIVISGVNNTNYGIFAGAFNYIAYSETAQTPYITCTPPYNVVGFDIVYLDHIAGTWTYQVDSGSTTTVTTTGSGSPNDSLKKVSITGLTSGSHTLKINSPATFGVCDIIGVTGYTTASSGLCFANMAWPGLGLVIGSPTGNDLFDTTNAPPDRLALYQGYQGPTSSPTSLTGLGFPAQPNLAIIALGVNDAIASVSRANFRDALDRLVWSLRYGKSDACSIIIAAMWCPDGTIGSSTTVANQDYSSNAYTAYRDLKAAMLECAQVNTCAFVDVQGLFGRTPITNGWITSTSDLHPTSAGHLKIANLLSAIL